MATVRIALGTEAGLTITKERLRDWSACSDGVRWFLSKFPQGGDYCAVQAALREDKRFDDARWLTDRAFVHAMAEPSTTRDIAADHTAEALGWIAETTALNVASDAPPEPDAGKSDAQIGSSGDYAQIGSSGDSAQINAEGANAVVAVAGQKANVRVGEGGAISVAYHDGKRVRFAVGYVGEGLKSLTWYSVNAAGEFVEVQL